MEAILAKLFVIFVTKNIFSCYPVKEAQRCSVCLVRRLFEIVPSKKAQRYQRLRGPSLSVRLAWDCGDFCELSLHYGLIILMTFVKHPINRVNESIAQRLGLEIPRTLITNDPDEFKRFSEQCHGRVIYKLLGFPLYHDEADQPVSTDTSLVPPEMLDQIHRVKATAHLFQEYIEKQCDLRIILIGNQVFAAEIHPLSEETRIDFRRDYRALRYALHCTPPTIQQALLRMNQYYRLNYAAVDMLSTPDGRSVYLETNPAGQFGWLDPLVDLPLSQTLAKLLARRV